jgi:hypothetical protein
MKFIEKYNNNFNIKLRSYPNIFNAEFNKTNLMLQILVYFCINLIKLSKFDLNKSKACETE